MNNDIQELLEYLRELAPEKDVYATVPDNAAKWAEAVEKLQQEHSNLLANGKYLQAENKFLTLAKEAYERILNKGITVNVNLNGASLNIEQEDVKS